MKGSVVVAVIFVLASRTRVSAKALSPCAGFSDSSVQTASCARNQTCHLTLAQDSTAPSCRVQFGKECRDILVKAPKEDRQPNAIDPSPSFPARLSRLGVLYGNFYVQIAIGAKDIRKGNVRGILMEFESDDELNCLYQIPSCRFFNFANESRLPSLGSGSDIIYPPNSQDDASKREKEKSQDARQPTRAWDGNETRYAKSNASHRRQKRRTKNPLDLVWVSHSCFGVDVEQGSFLLRLTSLPGHHQLVYHINWPYHNVPTDIWTELVVGVASIPGANKIHVIVQKPDKIPAHSQLHLQLWNASKHLIDTVTIPADKPIATFRRVPKGRYSVMVSPQGYRCSFTGSCPSFWSNDVFVDDKLVRAWPVAAVNGDANGNDKDSSDLGPTVVIVSALTVALVVLVLASVWHLHKRKTASRSGPLMLLVGLNSGRLEDIVIKHLADCLEQFSGASVRAAILNSSKYNTVTLKAIDGQEDNLQLSDSKSGDLSALSYDALKSYRSVAVVDFLHQYSQSEAGAGMDEEKSVARRTQLLLSLLPRRLRSRLCSVHMANASPEPPCDVSSSNRSSHDPAVPETDDSASFLTVYPGRDCKNHKPLEYYKKTQKCSDIPYFVLTTEAASFFQWVARIFKKSSLSFSYDFGHVVGSDHWQTLLTCLEKVFIDKNKHDYFVTTKQNDVGDCGDFQTIAEPSEFDCILALNNDNSRLPLTKISCSWGSLNHDNAQDCAKNGLTKDITVSPRDSSEKSDTENSVVPPLPMASITRLLSGNKLTSESATGKNTARQAFPVTTDISSFLDTISSDEEAVSLPLTESLSTLERNKSDRIHRFLFTQENDGDSFPGSLVNNDWASGVSAITGVTGSASSPREAISSTDQTSRDNPRVVLPPLSLAQTKLLGNRLMAQDLGNLSDVINDLVHHTGSSD